MGRQVIGRRRPVRQRVLLPLLVGMVFVTMVEVSPATATPICSPSASDSDGDGWGWENGASCKMESTTDVSSHGDASDDVAVCANTYDPDGDGWGWENDGSCIHKAATPTNLRIGWSGNARRVLLKWDPVPDATGYIVYRNGVEFARSSTAGAVGAPSPQDARFHGNFFVKAYKADSRTLSDASRPVRYEGVDTDPNSDTLFESGCRSGGPGENNAVSDLDFAVADGLMTVTLLVDCQADSIVVSVSDGSTTDWIRADGGAPFRTPVNSDTVYKVSTWSFFGDDSVQGDSLYLAVVDPATLGRAGKLTDDAARAQTQVVIKIASEVQNRESSTISLVVGSFGAFATGVGIGLGGISNPPAAIATAVGAASLVVSIGYGAYSDRLLAVSYDQLTTAVNTLLTAEGLNELPPDFDAEALVDRLLDAVDGQTPLTADMIVAETVSAVEEQFPADIDRDGIPDRLDPSVDRPTPPPVVVPDDNWPSPFPSDPSPFPIIPPSPGVIVNPVPPVDPIVPLPLPKTTADGRPYCDDPSSDPDGDGWGWENDASCVVR